MDRERFDALTKLCATKGSRRVAFAGLLSAALLGTGAEALAKSGKGKHRGQHQDRGKGHDNGRGKGRDQGNDSQDHAQPDQAKPRSARDEAADTAPPASDAQRAASDHPGVQAEAGKEQAKGPNRGNARSSGQGQGKGRGKGKSQGNGAERGARVTTQTSCYPGAPCRIGKGHNDQGCDFTGATGFQGNDVSGSNFFQANFTRVDATGANFRQTNLSQGCVVDTNLKGAKLSLENAAKAIFCRTIMPDGSINNSGCSQSTNCCQTCVAIDQTGCTIGGGCCGGAACNATSGGQGVCRCQGQCVTGNCCSDNLDTARSAPRRASTADRMSVAAAIPGRAAAVGSPAALVRGARSRRTPTTAVSTGPNAPARAIRASMAAARITRFCAMAPAR
jgi:hypothetical protein